MFFFFFQAEDGIRDVAVTGVQTCALPICLALPSQGVAARLLEFPDRLGQSLRVPRKRSRPDLRRLAGQNETSSVTTEDRADRRQEKLRGSTNFAVRLRQLRRPSAKAR